MSGIEAESITEVTQKAIAATEVEENKTPCFNDNVDEWLWVVDLMYRNVMEKCWKDSALAKLFASFFEVGSNEGLSVVAAAHGQELPAVGVWERSEVQSASHRAVPSLRVLALLHRARREQHHILRRGEAAP